MAHTFHLAIPGGNLETTLPFYTDILGCSTGNSEAGHWVDVNLWGNELTLHQTKSRTESERHNVDMGTVSVPHFGVHLEADDFAALKKRIEESDLDYMDKPYRRFKGSKFEQETFFVEDPNGNVLEMKTMMNPEVLFELSKQSLPTSVTRSGIFVESA